MTSNNNYIVATIKPWNISAYEKYSKNLLGNWHFITKKNELNNDLLTKLNPRYIFFPHWSWKVPENILKNYECVCFHMTDVPYGRGGSPLQNLIIRGHNETKLTALKMVSELDAGPIYHQLDLALTGRAQDIYENAADKVYEMISYIIKNEPIPVSQKGDIVVFKRRSPVQSRIPDGLNLNALYDHIRMLDADTYPHAFIENDNYKFEFTDAVILEDEINCKVTIKKADKK